MKMNSTLNPVRPKDRTDWKPGEVVISSAHYSAVATYHRPTCRYVQNLRWYVIVSVREMRQWKQINSRRVPCKVCKP